jgi:pilus assembly protein CpaE
LSKKIKVVMAKNNKESLNSTKQLLEVFSDVKVIWETNNGNEVIDTVIKFSPDIIIMDYNMASVKPLEICAKINQVLPYVGIILIGSVQNFDIVRSAMQSGANDFLEPPITSLKLYNSIIAINKIKQQQKRQLIKTPLVISNKKSKIITVFSSKGGVGKTVLSTNIAIGVNQKTREEILLMDLDLQFGDVADMLDIIPKTSITDLVNNLMDINEAKEIYKYVIPHNSGIKILPAPHDAEQADQINKDDLKDILKMFTQMFDYIVIDLPPLLNGITLASIENCDYLCLLTTMEIPTLKNVKESLDILKRIEFPEEKIYLVINRFLKNSDISISDVRKFLGLKKIFYVDENPDKVANSINSGEPIVLKYRQSNIAKQINEICNVLINERGVLDNRRDRSLLQRLKKRMSGKNE